MTRGRRGWLAWCALLIVGGASPAETISAARGAALFSGNEPMRATIREHTLPLPAGIASCRHCHTGSVPGQTSAGAPALTAALLLEQRGRRNGPPSAYSADSFCRVLRKGIDPAWIMVARAMPLFAASDAQCASLWIYLSGDRGKT